MNTILFIDDKIPFTCGFRLNSLNWLYAPSGRIRVAKFETSFSPHTGQGYYGDIYLRQFIRIWKNKIIMKKRQIEKKMTILCISKKNILNQDVLKYIISYL